MYGGNGGSPCRSSSSRTSHGRSTSTTRAPAVPSPTIPAPAAPPARSTPAPPPHPPPLPHRPQHQQPHGLPTLDRSTQQPRRNHPTPIRHHTIPRPQQPGKITEHAVLPRTAPSIEHEQPRRIPGLRRLLRNQLRRQFIVEERNVHGPRSVARTSPTNQPPDRERQRHHGEPVRKTEREKPGRRVGRGAAGGPGDSFPATVSAAAPSQIGNSSRKTPRKRVVVRGPPAAPRPTRRPAARDDPSDDARSYPIRDPG